MGWQDDPVAYPVDANTQRFLDFIGKSEGADYNTVVGGGKFDDFSKHPNKVGLRTKEGPSTAAGKYQILNSTYNDVAPSLGIKDFSPESQDRIAIELIKRGGALGDVEKGDYGAAIKKLGGTWASLPSSPYSQPKRSQGWVEKALDALVPSAHADEKPAWMNDPVVGSEATPAVTGAWMNDPVVGEGAAVGHSSPASVPTGSPKATTETPTVQSKTTAPAEKPKSILRSVDDFVRGAADAMTFGYADEIAAKMDSLVNGKSYEENLKAQRQRDSEGGAARVVGQLGGSLVAPGTVVRGMNSGSRLIRAGAGAATGAIQGGLYGAGSAEGDRIEGAKEGAALGAVTGGALGGILPATITQKGSKFIDKAGSEADAALNAEISKRAAQEFNNPARMVNGSLPPMGAKELNGKVTDSFIREGKSFVEQLPKDSDVRKPFLDALNRGVKNTQGELEALSKLPGGQSVVDIINKAQRADKMTAANPADNNLLVKGIRIGADYALPGIISKPINYLLNNRKTREEVGKKVVEQGGEIADNVLSRTGPSKASQALDELAEMARKAQEARTAAIDAAKSAKAAAKVPKVENPNVPISELQGKDPSYLLGLSNPLGAPRNEAQMGEFSKLIRQQMEARLAKQQLAKDATAAAKAVDPIASRNQVLQSSRVPLGGAYQELLQGGRSGLNMTTDQATDALRLVSKMDKNSPIGKAAKDMLKSKPVEDESAFYGVQNLLRRLSEEGKVSSGAPGVLSELSSGIRNPISYAANVRNAEEAAKIAREAAPSKGLAQFATKIAGTKEPASKLKLVEERLAGAKDQAEIDWLNQFVMPLTSFGKK